MESSRRGVASAVGTMFTILVVVMMIATYLANTFPVQMAAAEFQQTLAVQDQFLQLQADVESEVSHPGSRVAVTAPISLSGPGVPPMGPPAGSLMMTDAPQEANASYLVNYALVTSNTPTPSGSPCVESGVCAASGNTYYYTQTGSGTTLSPHISGGGNNIVLNISGSSDIINTQITGTGSGYILVVIYGTHDQFNLDYRGSTSTPNPVVGIVFYGIYDYYNATFSGGAAGQYRYVNTVFIPQVQNVCPWGGSWGLDDAFSISSASSVNNVQNLTWFNSQGYTTAYHTTAFHPYGNNNQIGWKNTSAWIPCAFTAAKYSSTGLSQFAGLSDTLNNRYIPPETLSYEEGAVVAGHPGNNSTMVQGPQLSITRGIYAPSVNLTIIQFLPKSAPREAGQGMIGVRTWLISEQTTTFQSQAAGAQNVGNVILVSPQYLNITTEYPGAWASWAQSYPEIFPVGASVGGCYSFQGTPVCQVTIPVYDFSLTLTIATVGISFTG